MKFSLRRITRFFVLLVQLDSNTLVSTTSAAVGLDMVSDVIAQAPSEDETLNGDLNDIITRMDMLEQPGAISIPLASELQSCTFLSELTLSLSQTFTRASKWSLSENLVSGLFCSVHYI